MVTIMPREQLEKRNTRNLLHILKTVNAQISAIEHYSGERCCEVCHEFLGDEEDWWRDVGRPRQPYLDYRRLLKEILATREHVHA